MALSCRHTSVTDPYGVFAPVRRTAQRSSAPPRAMASRWRPPPFWREASALPTPDLARLEAGLRDFPGRGTDRRGIAREKKPSARQEAPLLRSRPPPSLIAAADPYEEVEAAAREMVRLVRREGWRFGEMAVIVGQWRNTAIPWRQFAPVRHSLLYGPALRRGGPPSLSPAAGRIGDGAQRF